jgi:quercetin dioxygenase-like cupin family protein
MKKIVMALAAASFLQTASAPAEQSPFNIELENDQVRVLRIRLGPHERIPMHDVPPHVAVWLTDARLKVIYPDGRAEVQRFRAGQVQWVAIGRHAGENVGEAPVEFVAIESVRPR